MYGADLRRLHGLATVARKIKNKTYLADQLDGNINKITSIKLSDTQVQVLDIVFIKKIFPAVTRFICQHSPITYINPKGIAEGDYIEIDTYALYAVPNSEILKTLPPFSLYLGNTRLTKEQKKYFMEIHKANPPSYRKTIMYGTLAGALCAAAPLLGWLTCPATDEQQLSDPNPLYVQLFLTGFILCAIPHFLINSTPAGQVWVKHPSNHPSKKHAIGWQE